MLSWDTGSRGLSQLVVDLIVKSPPPGHTSNEQQCSSRPLYGREVSKGEEGGGGKHGDPHRFQWRMTQVSTLTDPQGENSRLAEAWTRKTLD